MWTAPTKNHGFYVLAESWPLVGAVQADIQMLNHPTHAGETFMKGIVTCFRLETGDDPSRCGAKDFRGSG
ncbi:MAG TPA: hypothetical protein VIX20_17255, partial [Ktedonobacteraceae bacterium]